MYLSTYLCLLDTTDDGSTYKNERGERGGPLESGARLITVKSFIVTLTDLNAFHKNLSGTNAIRFSGNSDQNHCSIHRQQWNILREFVRSTYCCRHIESLMISIVASCPLQRSAYNLFAYIHTYLYLPVSTMKSKEPAFAFMLSSEDDTINF